MDLRIPIAKQNCSICAAQALRIWRRQGLGVETPIAERALLKAQADQAAAAPNRDPVALELGATSRHLSHLPCLQGCHVLEESSCMSHRLAWGVAQGQSGLWGGVIHILAFGEAMTHCTSLHAAPAFCTSFSHLPCLDVTSLQVAGQNF